MDLLKLIKEKSNYFMTVNEDIGISSIVSHIEIAEKHFEGGQAGNEYLYNDVIYRTNQAFEGSLKEAFRIIEGKDPEKITTHKIERYFEDNSILKERVLKLFTNYRTEWRNESTHNYKLYFTEQEALLAIVSISAFVNILFDQMIEKQAYNREINAPKTSEFALLNVKNSISFIEKLNQLLFIFPSELSKFYTGTSTFKIKEAEVHGALVAYLNKYAHSMKVIPDYVFEDKSSKSRYYIDFVIEFKGEKTIIEIKGPNSNHDSVLRGIEQTFQYLFVTGIQTGILFVTPRVPDQEMIINMNEKYVDDKKYCLYSICPKHMIESK